MDHDLLLDLRHLDDPDPPRFGALRAEEAARRAADNHARRARLVAAAVLSVSLVAGIGAVTLSRGGQGDVTTAANMPTTAPAEAAAPDETTLVPTSAPAVTELPGTAPGGPVDPAGTVPPQAPSAPAAPGAPGGGGAPSGPPTTLAPAAAPTAVPPPARATGQPPASTVAAPADLRFTLTFDTTRVVAGGSIAARVRFENNRASAVTLVGGGCSMWRANLYDAGRAVTGTGPICPMALREVVAPGGVVEASVTVQTDGSLRPGTYDAFTTIRVDEINASIHTSRVVVEVVRP